MTETPNQFVIEIPADRAWGIFHIYKPQELPFEDAKDRYSISVEAKYIPESQLEGLRVKEYKRGEEIYHLVNCASGHPPEVEALDETGLPSEYLLDIMVQAMFRLDAKNVARDRFFTNRRLRVTLQKYSYDIRGQRGVALGIRKVGVYV